MAYEDAKPKKGPGSGRRSRRTENARRRAEAEAIEATSQPVEAPTGQPYGERQAYEAAASEIPIPRQPDLAQAIARAQAASPSGGLAGPSEHPDRPVTHGLPSGPGAGPEALAPGMGGVSDADIVRSLYRRFPTEAMRKLVERVDRAAGLDRAQAAMIPPSDSVNTPGSNLAVGAAWQVASPGTRMGRVAGREYVQAESGAAPTKEG